MKHEKKKLKKGQRRGDTSSSDDDQLQAAAVPAQRKANSKRGPPPLAADQFTHLDVDPDNIRFAHSRIRPVFSGCGRTLQCTLDAIRAGTLKASDLPVITVIQGPVSDDGKTWWFSLNNRRLWVFKAARLEGLLGSANTVRVRARGPKPHEIERYTLQNCSNNSTIMQEKPDNNQMADGDTAALNPG